MKFKTADLCDEFEPRVWVVAPLFQNYGGLDAFYGQIVTVKVFGDNALVREALETRGLLWVLAVDGGASVGCALVGDRLAQLAYANGWAGIVVNGYIRDSVEIAGIPIGLKALGTVPKKSAKKGTGERDVRVRFAGATFAPGQYLYADADGIILSENNLLEKVS